MVREEKVTLEKGAELADMDVQDFKKYVRRGWSHAHMQDC